MFRFRPGSGVSLAGFALLIAGVSPNAAHTVKADPLVPGLDAWRKPGKVDHAACANCHGPDGFEIAAYNFDDATIRRRAKPHLGDEDAEQIVDLIRAVRVRYRLTRLLDPMSDRPFQPGGSVLEGATPAERDLALARELAPKLPHLFEGRVSSLADAQKAADEVMQLDPWTVRIGVPLNRFSEDSFHGAEHASLAHWLPDVARTISDQDLPAWYALQDRYLATPNDDTLWAMIGGFDRLTRPPGPTGIASLAAEKYRSLLILQHSLRLKQLGETPVHKPVQMEDDPSELTPNPMWKVAETARLFQDASPAAIGLDETLMAKKTGGPTFRAQMLDLQASWFWLGWLFDQGLERTTRQTMAARGDWLAGALYNDGPYPIHNVYWLARKQLVMNRIPKAWGGLPARRRPEWDYLAIQVGGRFRTEMPTDPVQRQLYIRFASNCFRMSLYLMLDEWTASKVVWFKSAARNHVTALTQFILDFEPESTGQAMQLRAALLAAIDAGVEKD
jgi:hypothetical protein